MDPRTEFSSLERDRSPDEASGLARLRRIDRLCHHASSLSRKFQRTVRWAKPLRPSAGSSPAGASPPRRCAPSYLLVPPPPGPSSAQPDYPRIGIGCLRAKQIGACAIDQQPSQILIAAFGYPAQADFAAGRVCRGTRPSHAANSRPLRKSLGSTTVAAMAVAMIGPIRGWSPTAGSHGCSCATRHQLLLQRGNRCRKLLDLRSEYLQYLARQMRQPCVVLVATIAINWQTLRKPCGAITPNSARCARKAFTSIVRWRTAARDHGAAAERTAARPS